MSNCNMFAACWPWTEHYQQIRLNMEASKRLAKNRGWVQWQWKNARSWKGSGYRSQVERRKIKGGSGNDISLSSGWNLRVYVYLYIYIWAYAVQQIYTHILEFSAISIVSRWIWTLTNIWECLFAGSKTSVKYLSWFLKSDSRDMYLK